ncbi:MAG: DUF2232 domain-containing protein [Methyloprofundus sp.]|nr:DUF2232 domain-containing protein [Methyloprofundus sp.]
MQAVLVVASLALLSLTIILLPVNIVSSAAIALVTLRRGVYEGLLVLLSACLAVTVLGMVVFGEFQFILGYVVSLWMPVWLVSAVLREGRHLSLAVEVGALLGIVMVIGFYLLTQSPVDFWREMLSATVEPMLQAQAQTADVPAEKIQEILGNMAKYMTGQIAAMAFLGALFSLLLGRWWQSSLYNEGGFGAEYLALRLSKPFATATIATILIGTVASGVIAELAWNISIVLLMAYVFVGIAVVHTLLSGTAAKRFLIPFFYTMLVLLTLAGIPFVMLLVIFMGVSDTWLNLRKNITKPSSS